MSDYKQRLSISRFKDIPEEKRTHSERIDYAYAKLMNDVIYLLENIVDNDRVFKNSKHNVMKLFWDSRESLDEQ